MTRFAVLVVTTLAMALPANAFQTDGWDLGVEMEARKWRSASLEWAQSLRKDTPSAGYLLKAVVPPPREMWCVDARFPMYCGAWDQAMEQWLHHYLDIPYEESLPFDLPLFPKECSSTCETW